MKPIRFLHMSDLHFLEWYPAQGFAAQIAKRSHPADSIRGALQAEKQRGLDFVLLTGDLTHEGGESDYRALRRLFEQALGSVPVISLPGNHDPWEAYCRGFLQREPCSPPDSVQHAAGLRILTLDSGRSSDGCITEQQVQWLKARLDEPAGCGTLLALHHPLLDGQNGLPRAQYPETLREVIASGDILGVFCGHTHSNYAARFADKPYFTADSMSFAFNGIGGALEYQINPAYNRFSLTGGELALEVRQTAPGASEA